MSISSTTCPFFCPSIRKCPTVFLRLESSPQSAIPAPSTASPQLPTMRIVGITSRCSSGVWRPLSTRLFSPSTKRPVSVNLEIEPLLSRFVSVRCTLRSLPAFAPAPAMSKSSVKLTFFRTRGLFFPFWLSLSTLLRLLRLLLQLLVFAVVVVVHPFFSSSLRWGWLWQLANELELADERLASPAPSARQLSSVGGTGRPPPFPLPLLSLACSSTHQNRTGGSRECQYCLQCARNRASSSGQVSMSCSYIRTASTMIPDPRTSKRLVRVRLCRPRSQRIVYRWL